MEGDWKYFPGPWKDKRSTSRTPGEGPGSTSDAIGKAREVLPAGLWKYFRGVPWKYFRCPWTGKGKKGQDKG